MKRRILHSGRLFKVWVFTQSGLILQAICFAGVAVALIGAHYFLTFINCTFMFAHLSLNVHFAMVLFTYSVK